MMAGPFEALTVEGHDAAGEKMLLGVVENRQAAPGFTGKVEKDRLEQYHLDRFQADYALAHGQPCFDANAPGSDPPDFVVTSAGADSGLIVRASPSRDAATRTDSSITSSSAC